jgi:Scd6-like Sm domain
LISKKNIRYEGTLYSINESNATVALQNVRSFGTEGREKIDPAATFVAPQDDVHPYLLFRGCDIKDLHVHESAAQQPTPDPALASAKAPTINNQRPPETSAAATPQQPALDGTPSQENNVAGTQEANDVSESQDNSETNGDAKKGINNRPKKKNHPGHQVGTGASLLNRKVRGTKDGGKQNDDGMVGRELAHGFKS